MALTTLFTSFPLNHNPLVVAKKCFICDGCFPILHASHELDNVRLLCGKIPPKQKMRYSFSMTHRKDGAFFMTASISQELR
ncbi:hypothetical protein D1872_188150 [compost metagenome]